MVVVEVVQRLVEEAKLDFKKSLDIRNRVLVKLTAAFVSGGGGGAAFGASAAAGFAAGASPVILSLNNC